MPTQPSYLTDWNTLFLRVGLPSTGRTPARRPSQELKVVRPVPLREVGIPSFKPLQPAPAPKAMALDVVLPRYVSFEVEAGPIGARLIALRVWLRERFAPKKVLVCDHHGLPVELGTEESEELGSLALFRGTHGTAQKFLNGALLPYIVIHTQAGGLANLFFSADPGLALSVLTLNPLSNDEMNEIHAAFKSAIGEGC